ncbi:MAG: LON peptidase substrate-binding domain-containing protein [Sandaracinaceae bacterium]
MTEQANPEGEVEEPVEPLTPDELAALPVFPLPGIVFFPGTMLPLHLFEPRYRDMMRDCMERGPRAMVVARLADGWEDDYEGRPQVHDVAGVGRIVDHAKRPDGRYDLILAGVHRVRLEELPPEGFSYRRARATVIEDREPHPEVLRPLVTGVLASASGVVSLLRRRHPDFGLGIDGSTPPGLIADRIADRLLQRRRDVDLRQQLLEQPDVKVRLALVQDAVAEILLELSGEAGGSVH